MQALLHIAKNIQKYTADISNNCNINNLAQ